MFIAAMTVVKAMSTHKQIDAILCTYIRELHIIYNMHACMYRKIDRQTDTHMLSKYPPSRTPPTLPVAGDRRLAFPSLCDSGLSCEKSQ